MRRIAGTQTRTQREQQRKYMEKLTQGRSKTVEFNEKSSLKLKKASRPTKLQLKSENTMFNKEHIKPPAIRRMGSSPRTGLMPADTYSPRRPSVDSESGSEAVSSSTPTTPRSPSQLKIPSVSFNDSKFQKHAYAFSTPVKKSFSLIGDDVFDENSIEISDKPN
uniref:Uncharacterized protein n=1 Tax=Panagrolaimus sp. ES5 TaxID=591445 RepID=A0AC34F9I8_9BILA